MPHRALSQKRPYLVLSVLAALAYFYLQATNLPGLYLIPIKGSAVAFLALYAWMRHGSRDARMLTAALVFASLGDMAIELDLIAGAVGFVGFHIIALLMFLRHKREALEGRDSVMFIALLLGTPFVAYLLPYDPDMKPLVALYALPLGAMAAGAWASDFPQMRVAAGAILFVISDWLIFAEMGPLSGSPIPQYLVWPIYYLGIFLITIGVITTLRKRDPELRVVKGGAD
ncbi:lysoplasmalogenase family protein [Aurantiacibacter sp. MUD61]|uniref:lysoplasmalogenase family protein n=1 Tax=Aurantiacibacter sp. MUD61 TaxID=3009083 RepID=UPI0022F0F8D0|nr:lysoplasmalogenase family protein [Aurantiacibacter sp. MUD61]